MTRMEIFQELNKIFRNIFDDDSIVVTDETTSYDIDDWDSLEQINLIVAIEHRFGFEFVTSEVSNLQNVGEMADLIEKKLN